MGFEQGVVPISSRAVFARISAEGSTQAALAALGLQPDTPTLVLVGGAGGMPPELTYRISTYFEHELVPFIEAHRIAVVDGGTSAGVMEAMGKARAGATAHFPLIGVVVEKLLEREAGLLQEDHTHFLLTPGSDWGDEVPWLSRLATALAGRAPSLTMLINGGEIAWKDAMESISAGRSVLVVEGTGRAADQISQTSSGLSNDRRAVQLLKSKLVAIGNPYKQPEQFRQRLKDVFERPGTGP